MHSCHKSVCRPALPWLPILTAAVLWLLALALARAQDPATPPPRPGYETGLTNILKLAGDLHVALDPKKQQAVHAMPVYLGELATPCLAPIEIQEAGSVRHTVQFSAGFILLANSLAHAKALTEPGNDFLKAYAARLAAASGDALPPVAEGLAPDKAWSFDTMNVQAGQFNQMAGALIAVDLAHHYLGHYKKYAAQLPADRHPDGPTINDLVSEKEWRDAVLKGAKNALDCGLGVDGLKTLLECLDAMPKRPAWTAHFAPAKANLSKMNRELQRLENDFFLVEK